MKTDAFKELQPGVYAATDVVVKVDREQIRWLVETADSLSRKRARLCAQRSNDTAIHEMLIALGRETYVRPHMHTKKTESFHVVEGLCDVVLFDSDGGIREVISLGDFKSGRVFFYRIADPIFHTLVIRSPVFVIHETTNGPFDPADTITAAWAPEESNAPAAKAYMEELSRRVDEFLTPRGAAR
ncbi:MAG TPA: WbuC family cupin fold metalloprotein [Chthoniobacteraceae bacterium]|nr:WbuC family cupin fold metalloprotein [Chthoniobacteraceae bacterium]